MKGWTPTMKKTRWENRMTCSSDFRGKPINRVEEFDLSKKIKGGDLK